MTKQEIIMLFYFPNLEDLFIYSCIVALLYLKIRSYENLSDSSVNWFYFSFVLYLTFLLKVKFYLVMLSGFMFNYSFFII